MMLKLGMIPLNALFGNPNPNIDMDCCYIEVRAMFTSQEIQNERKPLYQYVGEKKNER